MTRTHTARLLPGAVVLLLVAYAVLVGTVLTSRATHAPLALYGASWAFTLVLAALLSRPSLTPRLVSLLVLGGAVLLQVAALTHGPTTSDDVYRYVWDGRVQLHGIDPYAYPPASPHLQHLRDGSLFGPPRANCSWPLPDACSRINRPTVRTVYPPVAQLIFDGARLVSFGGHGGVRVFQLLGALGVLAVTALLLRAATRAGRPLWPVALWAWSPIAVLEYGNNAHIDWAAVLLALLCLEAARRARPGWAGLLLAAATLTKIYPALVGPAVLRRRPLVVLGVAAATVVVAYLPHVLAVGPDVIGFLPGYLHEEGYNSGQRLLLLGPVLPHPLDTVVGAMIVAAAAVWCWRRADATEPERWAVALIGITFLVTTPSYGWYAGLLLALVVLTGRLEWLPVVAAPTVVYLAHTEVSNSAAWATGPYAVALALTVAALAARRARSHRVGGPTRDPRTSGAQ